MTAPDYRESVRGHIGPDVIAALWQGCFSIIEDWIETLPNTCWADLEKLDVKRTLRSIHADPTLKNDLQFWIGQNLFALQEYPNFRISTVAAIEA